MNRLELVQRLIFESGASGLKLGSTLNQSGDARNFVNWIDDAWLEVCGLRNWPSMWEQAPLTFTAGTSILAQSLAHKRYEKDTAKIGTTELTYYPWDEFRDLYPVIQDGNPSAWSIRPDRSVALSAIVAADTVVTVERYKRPVRPTQDTDIPPLFEEHHMAIVWRALMLYAGFDEAGVAYKRGAAEYGVVKRLAADDLPSMTWGDPLL